MEKYISPGTIKRLPMYLRALTKLQAGHVYLTSSIELGKLLSLTPSQIRQDLSIFGYFGKTGKGYFVAELKAQIEHILGVDRGYRAVLIGCGNMGRAIMNNLKRSEFGINIEAAFDTCRNLNGTTLYDVPVYDADTLLQYLAAKKPEIAILTIPGAQAAALAAALSEHGIKALLNFTGENIELPSKDVIVENVQFLDSFYMLGYGLALG